MTGDHDRDTQTAGAVSSLRTKIPQGVDRRIINIIELHQKPDGEYIINGDAYSVDNDGNDVSVSWGDDIRPDYILYLIGDDIIYISSGIEIARLSIHEAIQNTYRLVELSETIQS